MAVVSRQRLRSAPTLPTRSLVQLSWPAVRVFACASAADKSDPTHLNTRTRISGKRSSGKNFKHPPSRNPRYAPVADCRNKWIKLISKPIGKRGEVKQGARPSSTKTVFFSVCLNCKTLLAKNIASGVYFYVGCRRRRD